MNQAGSTPTPPIGPSVSAPPVQAPSGQAGQDARLRVLIKDQILNEAWRRGKGRDLAPLLRLFPLVRAHPVDAILGMVFMLISSGAILALTAGARWVIDGGFAVHDKTHLLRVFLLAGAAYGCTSSTSSASAWWRIFASAFSAMCWASTSATS